MAKTAKNLYLDPGVVEHGERYGRLHGTSLSRLVSDFLRALPLGPARDLSPAVRRLIGAGVPRGREVSAAGSEEYREHLMEKYGQR
jgi:hypothetical protein